MKTNKITSIAKARTRTIISPKPKGSTSLKVSPSAGNSPGPKPASASARPPGATAPSDPVSDLVCHSADAVRARAYLNYQKRGLEDGNHTEDWLRAEAELAAEHHQGQA